jgi:hypothetical protein
VDLPDPEVPTTLMRVPGSGNIGFTETPEVLGMQGVGVGRFRVRVGGGVVR